MLLGSPSSEPCSLPGALTHPACPDTPVVGCPLCQTRGGGRRAGGSAHFAVCLSAPAVLPLRTDSPLRFSKAACQMPLRFAEGQCGSCAEGTGLKRGNMSVFLFNYYFGGRRGEREGKWKLFFNKRYNSSDLLCAGARLFGMCTLGIARRCI